jgi:hypothetical protein
MTIEIKILNVKIYNLNFGFDPDFGFCNLILF